MKYLVDARVSVYKSHALHFGAGGEGLIYNLYTVPNIVPVFGLNKVKTIQQNGINFIHCV